MTPPAHLRSVRSGFHAVVRAAVPAAVHLDDEARARVEAVVERALDDRPEGVRRQVRLFLRVLSAWSLVRFGRPLGRLDPERARRLLGSLERSRLLLLRRGVWGLRTLAFMGFYGRPEGRDAVGYRASLRGWEDRPGGKAGPWPDRRGAAPPEDGVLLTGRPDA